MNTHLLSVESVVSIHNIRSTEWLSVKSWPEMHSSCNSAPTLKYGKDRSTARDYFFGVHGTQHSSTLEFYWEPRGTLLVWEQPLLPLRPAEHQQTVCGEPSHYLCQEGGQQHTDTGCASLNPSSPVGTLVAPSNLEVDPSFPTKANTVH